ncbi:hypothetical protein RYZ27_12690 [Hyphomonas sp. FCG-A18]|jgi:hypothetical protein|uniref:hypothetical protein n=1 Tax=Hyphomonas sp. FCG-A18 TaxID=3080019 RepID=UPI002B2C77A3|nr:hypothetical protein RYZ27_12690 [Hyphomonas sp. FCG-A18]
MARSPSYPQFPLPKCIDFARDLYRGAHRSALDNDTIVTLIGYSPRSGSGLAAVSALKQFGLVEGRDESIALTDLAMTLLEPLDMSEYSSAYRQAALTPDLFRELYEAFGSKEPAESVVRSLAVRKYDFTTTGAEKLFRSYLATAKEIVEEEKTSNELSERHGETVLSEVDGSNYPRPDTSEIYNESKPISFSSDSAVNDVTVLQFTLSKNCTAKVELKGDVDSSVFSRLIAHLELSSQVYNEDL